MPVQEKVDFYEVLQVSPNADSDTIERVFRHLAKRFHPDNATTGNAERFTSIVEAFRTLSDPEGRASYDIKHEGIRQSQWEVLDQASAGDDVESDRRIRLGILSLLYSARRQDVERPGLGIYELERLLGCPEHHMKFHIWYLKANGWIERLENGQFAITANGVDKVVESDIPWRSGPRMLQSGTANGDPGTGRDESRRDEARRDEARRDEAGRDGAGRDEAGRDEAEPGRGNGRAEAV